MAVNKVVYDGSTLIDLTGDTVSPETLAEGVTAHDKSGAPITGTMQAGGGGGDDLFASLIDGTISGTIRADVSKIAVYKFTWCSLSEAIFPACISIGDYAFSQCRALSTISFPACTEIGNAAFSACSSLIDVYFPVCTSIGGSAFYLCSSLKTIRFPEAPYVAFQMCCNCNELTDVSVPKASIINGNAFMRCSKLTVLSFPVCTVISSAAFSGCQKLSALILANPSVCNLSNSNALSGTAIKNGNGYVYVPSSLVASYKAATNWTYYSNQISAIEDSEFA